MNRPSRRLAIGALVLLVVAFPLGCETDPSITDPAAALFQGVQLSSSAAFVPNGGGQTELSAQVLSPTGQALRGVRVVFETTAGDFPGGSEAMTDEAGFARTSLQTSNRAVVKASVGDMQSDGMIVDVDSPVTIDIDHAGKAFKGQSEQFQISAKRKDGHAVMGKLKVQWGDGKSNTYDDFNKSTKVNHTYSETGNYKMKAEITQLAGQKDTGTESVEVAASVKIQVNVTADPAFPVVGRSVTFAVTAVREDGADGKGSLLFEFGDGTQATKQNFDGKALFNKQYKEEGTYRAMATLSATNGADDSASVSVKVSEKGAKVAGDDELDLGQVTFLHANISRWTQSSRITKVSIGSGQVCVYHTKAGRWPVKVLSGVAVEGNPWVVVKRDGRWYAGTYEWLRPGQICKGITAGNIGGHIKQSPLANWRPRSGEQIGFIVSTLSRDANRTSNERTNVVLVRWP
jgi:hypothetical protein